jgi:hypothetical protein
MGESRGEDEDRFLPDGKEAEELRAGIETLMERASDGLVTIEQLQILLDSVDARDSLSYLEAQDRAREKPPVLG